MKDADTEIIEVSTGDTVQAEIHKDSHQQHAAFINRRWQPILLNHAKQTLLQKDGTFLNGLPAKQLLTQNQIADYHWDWEAIANQAQIGFRRKTFYLTHQHEVQGALHALFPKQSISLPTSNLVYVDFIAVAPWNRRHFQQMPLFKAVGSALMVHTCNCSFSEGYDGVIGLHSLIQAEPFYQNIGMNGLFNDPQKNNMKYFELPPLEARELVSQI